MKVCQGFALAKRIMPFVIALVTCLELSVEHAETIFIEVQFRENQQRWWILDPVEKDSNFYLFIEVPA